MSEYFLEPKSLGGRVKVELDFFIFLTNRNKKKVDLANLKSNADKVDIDKLISAPTNLSNLKSTVDKLDVDKLVPVPVDLSKQSDVVKHNVVKKDAYN